MARRGTRAVGGPEIDAREKSIIDLQTMCGQTRTLQREELGYGQADEVLILPVSESVRDFAPPCSAMSTWYEALGRPVTLLEALAKCGKSIFAIRILGSGLCPVCGLQSARIEARQHPIAGSCLTPAKRNMGVG
jgi:hypothetical protein